MPPKTSQLQIRVTAAEKALLKRRASAAGMDVSRYVLRRALPPVDAAWDELVTALGTDAESKAALTGLNALLSRLDSGAFQEVVSRTSLTRVSPFLQNYLAAMVEETARRHGVPAPAWTATVVPLNEPYFAADLPGLRPYLLRTAPVAFKRRNLFVDATVGEHL